MTTVPVQISSASAAAAERVTWRIAGAFYWGLLWRAGLAVAIIALPRGFLVGWHYPEPFKYDLLMWWIATLLQIPASLWILKRILERGISGYRINVHRR